MPAGPRCGATGLEERGGPVVAPGYASSTILGTDPNLESGPVSGGQVICRDLAHAELGPDASQG